MASEFVALIIGGFAGGIGSTISNYLMTKHIIGRMESRMERIRNRHKAASEKDAHKRKWNE